MQMPEGWKRLENKWMGTAVFKGVDDQVIAVLLLREMAEALEKYSDACHKGYGRDIAPIDDVLKKFRSWK